MRITLAFLLMAATAPMWAKAAPQPLEVFVSIGPQAYFVRRIGGEHVQVHVLVKPGQEPHTFEPTPRQMMALARARLYFAIGMPFETRLIQKIHARHQRLTVVDTAKGIKRRMMTHHRGGPHAAERPTEKEHQQRRGHRGPGEPDPHIWLSPPLIKVQAKNIAEALIAADPEHGEHYKKNLASFLRDIDRTHARIGHLLKPYKGRSFYVFHPAFGYFADAYGLKQKPVEMEGKRPTPRQLSRLIQSARADGVKIIFVQPQFSSKSAEAVAWAINGAVVPIDPLAPDVLKNLQQMADKIERALAAGRRKATTLPDKESPNH